MAPHYLDPKDPAAYKSLLDAHDTFLFDLDGVVWGGPGGTHLTPNVSEALDFLRSQGKRIAFVTNNATKSRSAYLTKFHSLGLSASLEEIFTCGSASASYLRKFVLPGLEEGKKGIYVVGQEGLEEELRAEGLEWTGGSDPIDDVLMPFQDFTAIVPDASIGVVLFSFQMHLNYQMMCKAFTYLATNKECKLVLTNDDATVLIPGGTCPGAYFSSLIRFRF
jgi:4-nitrophenyl phosphatase